MRNKDLDGILPSEEPPMCLQKRIMDGIPSANIATGKINSADLQGILPAQNPDDALLARVIADMPATQNNAQNQTTDAEMLAILPNGKPSQGLYARILNDIPELEDASEDTEDDLISSKWLKAGMVALGVNVSISSYAMAEAYISQGMSLFSTTLLMSLGG